MSLIDVQWGSLADPETINKNFKYLEEMITNTSAKIYTNNSSLESKILTLSNDVKTSLNDKIRAIGHPLFRLDNTIYDDEIRLEGAEVSRETYASLFSIYGTTYGEGDGSTTFNLPDCRKRAFWGDETFGYIEAGLPNILGTGAKIASTMAGQVDGAFYLQHNPNTAWWTGSGYADDKSNIKFDASRSNPIYGKTKNEVLTNGLKFRVVTRYK